MNRYIVNVEQELLALRRLLVLVRLREIDVLSGSLGVGRS